MSPHGDPELYRRLSEPWPTPEDANAAMREFDAEVGKLREKYRVPNLIAVCEVNALRPEDGREGACTIVFRWGNAAEHEALVARALGKVQADRQWQIAEVLREESLRVPRGV